MQCSKCTAPLGQSDKFCEACGTPVPHAVPPTGLQAPVPGTASLTCKCGSTTFDDQDYCLDCGSKALPARAPQVKVLNELLACVSDPGRKHPLNQDAACVAVLPNGAVFLGVADGVSSAQASEVASRTAVDTVLQTLRTAGEPLDAQALKHAVLAAHAQIKRLPYKKLPNMEEPEATIVVALFHGQTLHVAWVGDSRAYALSTAGATCLSRDDSWLHQALEGGMAYEQAIAAPYAHAITQCLGMLDAEPEVHALSVELKPGQDVLLCTDGLWNYFDSEEALHALYQRAAGEHPAVNVAQALVDAANAAGGRDNISVALLRR